jgi:hypothetical protein
MRVRLENTQVRLSLFMCLAARREPQSPLPQRGWARSHRMCDSAGALPYRETESGAVGRVTTS